MRSVVLCGVLNMLLVAGLHAQVPGQDWRPSVADNNKAATWEDTAAFIQSAFHDAKGTFYDSEKQEPAAASDLLNFTIPSRCNVKVTSPVYLGIQGATSKENKGAFHASHFAPAPPIESSAIVSNAAIDLSKVDPLSIHVFPFTSSDRVRNVYRVAVQGHELASFGSVKSSVYREVNWEKSEQSLLTPCGLKHCQENEGDVRGWIIDFDDMELSRRFARATLHASLLCGATKAVSPF